MDLTKIDRIVLIRHIENTYADISIEPMHNRSIPLECGGSTAYYLTPHPAFDGRHDVYLFPFLLNSDGSPWQDANLFFFSSIKDGTKGYSISDAVRQKAGMLLDYKIFCEENNIDMMDFSGRKPQRPTYRYFISLLQKLDSGEIKRRSLNKKTKVVYDFYKYLSKQANGSIEMERVDTVETVKMFFKNHVGRSYSIDLDRRGQSLSVSRQSAPVPIGFVRENGEDLRPLRESEVDCLLDVLQEDLFAVDERLMHYIALYTGARKQSILTMRMKHLNDFSANKLLRDGTFKVNAGPGTSIDTKFNKEQSLYFPKSLAEQIRMYANCQKARRRREKFLDKNGGILDDGEMYIFLSPEGEPHYMAKSDPRYKTTKSRPQGRNTYYMKKKLLKYTSKEFPGDFTFHWLRATFAFRYYSWLKPLCAKGKVTDGDIISMVQNRLHHSDRSTTEHYLRLFDSIDERLVAQTLYEERVFNLYDSDSVRI